MVDKISQNWTDCIFDKWILYGTRNELNDNISEMKLARDNSLEIQHECLERGLGTVANAFRLKKKTSIKQ